MSKGGWAVGLYMAERHATLSSAVGVPKKFELSQKHPSGKPPLGLPANHFPNLAGE